MIKPELDSASNIMFNPIVDGIVDCAKYLEAPRKILWVLREFHNKAGEITNLREVMKSLKNPGAFVGYRNTYGPVAKVSYSILKNCFFESNPNFGNPIFLSEYLEQIAIINIKKVPNFNGTYINWSELNKAFELSKGIIQRQILLFQPDIIVCAGTFEYIKDMNIENALLICAYHPSQRKITHEKYINSIMRKILV
jgi:hypothetical protein